MVNNRALAIAIAGSLIAIMVVIVVVSMSPDTNVPNPEEQIPSTLSLTGVSPHTFNPIFATLQFSLSGKEFNTSPDEISLTLNGITEPSTNLLIEPHRITSELELFDGLNNITFSALDSAGGPLYYNTSVWAGGNTLRVDIVDENGLPFSGPATVKARLSDDPSVIAQASTTTGTVELQNLLSRTILVHAAASDNRFGQIGVIGDQGSAIVRLLGFKPVSSIDNNDFSQGTAGWDISTATVKIVPHIEGFPPPAELEEETPVQFSPITPGHLMQISFSKASFGPQLVQVTTNSFVDNDLSLFTSGQGEQSISRTFATSPDTTAVVVRYRFITTEVPGGYYGSEFNDYFRVSLRSQQGGGSAAESNTMNGLGLGAFDFASGATAWREVRLPTSQQGDTIQVDVGVANVADDLLDSQVVIDFVREETCALTSYTGSNFVGDQVIADSEFVDSLDEINTIASNNNVQVHVTSSFRQSGQPVGGAIVPPATRSNHLAGHAIDMNVRYNGMLYNSASLHPNNLNNLPQAVQDFIQDIQDSSTLRWGGNFDPVDPVHIDDNLNSDRAAYDARFTAAQTARQSGCM